MAVQQVNKDVYSFEKYCTIERWSSYWYQIKEVLQVAPESILEIGVGDKVFANYIKNNTSIKYNSLDIAEDLQPDIVGDIENLSAINDNAYDLVCAFEVLEHLPYDKFREVLKELRRISKKNIIISLPHWGRHFAFEIKLPFFGKVSWQYKCNLFPIGHKFKGQHYWEIGKSGYSFKKIKSEIEKVDLEVLKDYVVFESPYHHFFILEKRFK